MKKFLLPLLLVFPVFLFSQVPLLYQSNYIRVVQPDFNDPNLKFDTLLNPYTGGMNSPTFFNMDINGDGIPDLFMFDRDVDENYVLNFMATKKNSLVYRYTPYYESAFPQDLNKWASIGDYNLDGLPDIYTHSVQNSTGIKVYKNTSYIDPITKKFTLRYNLFQDVLYFYDSLSGTHQIGVPGASNPVFVDVDKDGYLDILTFDINLNNVEFFRNRSIYKDSLQFYYTKKCFGYFEENAPHLYIPWNCERNGAYTGQWDPKHYKQGAHGYSALCAMDVDGDGDMDLLLGDGGNDSLAFLNNGRDKYKKDTIINISTTHNNNNFPIDDPAIIHAMPMASPVDVNNDGLMDLIVAGGQPSDTEVYHSSRMNNIWYYQNAGTPSTPIFLIKSKNFLQNTMIDWGVNSAPCFIDVDKDGRKDLIVAVRNGGAKHGYSHLVLYLNKPAANGGKPYLLYTDNDYLGLSSYTYPVRRPIPASYLNGKDSKTDLLMGNDSGRIMYYKDESAGNKVADFKLVQTSLKYLVKGVLTPIDVGYNSSPTTVDFNKDGKTDLLIGANDGRLSYYRCAGYGPAPDYVPYFELVTNTFGGINATLGHFQSAPCITDLNKNGKPDLLLGDKDGELLYFPDIDTINTLVPYAGSLLYDYRTGARSTGKLFSGYLVPTAAYLDQDSIPDLMLGGRRGGLVFLGSANNGFEPVRNSGIETAETIVPIKMTLFPNPARDFFVLRYNNVNELQRAEICVTDMMGRQLFKSALVIEQGQGDYRIPSTGLHNGMYIVNIMIENRVVSADKVIINK
jgi:hypothetical protein